MPQNAGTLVYGIISPLGPAHQTQHWLARADAALVRLAVVYLRPTAFFDGMFLVQGVKGSNAPVELRPGLVLHDAGNRFRPEAEAILRQGAGLSLRNRPVRP
jgi:tRNA1(Val) A37 N6-methylase TrmN6